MIRIVENRPRRVPGYTSLIVKFDYRSEYVDIMKTMDGAAYHKRDKLWEIPYINLSALLDALCLYDDIEFIPFQEKQEEPSTEITSTFKTKLFPYQEDGVRYGLAHDKWLLLDCTGLGKSVQLLYIAQELKERGEAEHCLIYFFAFK